MAGYHKIVSVAVKILDTFDPGKCGIDNHLKNYLEDPDNVVVEVEGAESLIDEVVSGCVRYKSLIKAGLELYYTGEGRTCLRADYNLYAVVSYLAMFRLEEVGVKQFKKIICTQQTVKLLKFLGFLFDRDNLAGAIRQQWNVVFDHTFVTANVFTPMMSLSEEMLELLDQVSDRLASKNISSKPTTEIKAFNLTAPQPRRIIAEVEEIPSVKPHKPVPRSTYRKPPEEDKLAVAFETNRIKAENILLEAEHTQFSCANPEKSAKTQRILEKIMAEEEEKARIKPVRAVPVPPKLNESRPIKLNAAAIYREGARIQKEDELLREKFAKLEAGDGDATKFLRWQQDMKERAAAEEVAEIERKHLAGQISYEEAILARQQLIQDKKEQVQKFQDESRQLMEEYFVQKREDQQEMRRLVEATTAGQQNIRDARNKLTAMKQKIVQQVAKENQELMAKALEQEEIEMRKKSELIRQIYAMEKVPIIRANFLDLTATSGLGFLSEMSIVELRERLSLMKIAEEEEMREKRAAIKETKQAKEQHLQETVETISQYKAEKKKHSAIKREDGKRMFKAHHEQLKAEKIVGLQKTLDDKRKERMRQQKFSMHALPAASIKNFKGSMKPVQSQSSSSSLPHKTHHQQTDTYRHKNQHLAISSPANALTTLIRTTNRT